MSIFHFLDHLDEIEKLLYQLPKPSYICFCLNYLVFKQKNICLPWLETAWSGWILLIKLTFASCLTTVLVFTFYNFFVFFLLFHFSVFGKLFSVQIRFVIIKHLHFGSFYLFLIAIVLFSYTICVTTKHSYHLFALFLSNFSFQLADFVFAFSIDCSFVFISH